jgi:hypothetical protein
VQLPPGGTRVAHSSWHALVLTPAACLLTRLPACFSAQITAAWHVADVKKGTFDIAPSVFVECDAEDDKIDAEVAQEGTTSGTSGKVFGDDAASIEAAETGERRHTRQGAGGGHPVLGVLAFLAVGAGAFLHFKKGQQEVVLGGGKYAQVSVQAAKGDGVEMMGGFAEEDEDGGEQHDQGDGGEVMHHDEGADEVTHHNKGAGKGAEGMAEPDLEEI